MVDVSGMLMEFYKTNLAKAPKTQQQQLQLKYRQTSPASAETLEPSTIAAIATNGAAEEGKASKNLQGGEMSTSSSSNNASNIHMKSLAFHPRIKYTSNKQYAAAGMSPLTAYKNEHNEQVEDDVDDDDNYDEEDDDGVRAQQKLQQTHQLRRQTEPVIMTAIPTSVVVPTSPQIDVKPLIHPTTGLVIEPTPSGAVTASVIRQAPTAAVSSQVVPQAAAIAAAILQQQFQRQTVGNTTKADSGTSSSKILEKLLRQQRHSVAEHDHHDANDDSNADDDEYDERYNDFDIQLTEDGKQTDYSLSSSLPNLFQSSMASGSVRSTASGNNANSSAATGEYLSEESQKLLIVRAQAQAMRNLEYTLGDFSASNGSNGGDSTSSGARPSMHEGGEPVYECCHCGKKYRWKSTLRRHENVECGGKEPSHQCPYCPYKSKQRGNLGVHVRKHHSDLPQLASKRRSKYSQQVDYSGSNGTFSANASDDSSSKLVIDFSKKE